MKKLLTIVLGTASVICIAGGAQAYTRHPSTPAERAQTKALNEQQLQLAKEQNGGSAQSADTSSNSEAAATDASQDTPASSSPGAAAADQTDAKPAP